VRSEKEIKEKIKEVIRDYAQGKLRDRTLSDYIATTYTVQTLFWVLEKIDRLPIEYLKSGD